MSNYKSLLTVLLLSVLVYGGTALGQATIDVSPHMALTADNAYDRNPSVVDDGVDYWLFYTKGDDTGTSGVRGPMYNPDTDTYVVYYKTAASIDALGAAAETRLDLSETARPADFDQRVVSAAYLDGMVYAFVSSGQSGTDRGLYYYDFDGSTWAGPYTLIADAAARGGHVNVTADSDRMYIVWESSDGSSDCYTFDGATLSGKIDISSDNQPKINLMGTSLYVVSIEDGTGDIEVYTAAASATPAFSSHSTAIAGSGFYDPCIFNDGTNLYVVNAPWVAVDRQYLLQTMYSGGGWTPARTVSYGGYGAVEWWEYWPVGFYDGADLYLFFTTESDNTHYSDGEIACVKMDWDLSRDHYLHVQNGVDEAFAGDTIHIASGNYEEQLLLNKEGLVLQGDGVDVTVIQSPETLVEYFTTSSNNYPVIYIHDVSNVEISGLTLDGMGRGNANYRFNGFGIWNAGCTLSNIRATRVRDTPFSGSQHGVSVYAYNNTGGPYTVTLTDVHVDDFQKNAFALNGTGLTTSVSNCSAVGAGPTTTTAQNGIQVWGAEALITDCTVSDIAYTGSGWAASGFLLIESDVVTMTGANSATACQVGVLCQETNGAFDGLVIGSGTLTSYNEAVSIREYGTLKTRSGKATFMPPQPFGDRAMARRGGRANQTVLLSHLVLTGNGLVDSYGIIAWGLDEVTTTDNILLTVTDSTIDNWEVGILAYEYASATDLLVTGTSISNCDQGFYGYHTIPGSIDLECCNITGNDYGLYLAGTAVPAGDADYNNFSGNTSGAVYIDPAATGGPLDALFCYYGAPTGPSGSGTGSGDAVTGNVTYDPYQAAAMTVCLPVTAADFMAPVTTVQEGGAVDFNDLSVGLGPAPWTWAWSFEGGSPSTSTDRHPTGITYAAAGTYDVTLVFTDGAGNDTELKVDYITVAPPPPLPATGPLGTGLLVLLTGGLLSWYSRRRR